MKPRQTFPRCIWLVLCFGLLADATAAEPARADRFASHPPTRPLPVAASRPMADGPALFVDAARGHDDADGSEARPWKSLAHAVSQLKPGDTLYLRGGVYYEHVVVKPSGTARQPITIRSYPGELATIDGGLREFLESPATAWESCPDGVEGEFWSSKTYPDLGGDTDSTNVLGNFGDSLLPLQGYRFRGDLQSSNPFWNVGNKVGSEASVYCGPGVWYDVATGRIHCRLAHAALPGLGDDNYRGETDPRKLPLIIAGHRGGSPMILAGCQHVRLQDLVLRGSREATLAIRECSNIELDGLTVYGGSTAIEVRDSAGLRMQHTACRGIAAPWTFRGSLKYRAIEARIFSASGWIPTGADNRDFEMAWCEFTDCVDGVFIGNVRGVRFHHNLLDNVSDDGIFLTAGTAYDCTTPGGDVHIYQNLLSRCLTTFAFGVGHGRQKTIATGKQTGSGVYIFRNVFDFRRPVHYYWPTGPDAPQEISSGGRFASDHGSPAWEPMWIYHNTILAADPPRYEYGTNGLSGAMGHGTTRRVFNNIICQLRGLPGQVLPETTTDFQADGNLFWSVSDGAGFKGEWCDKFRRSSAFQQSQSRYAPGWTERDQFADPRFAQFHADWREPVDLRPRPGSPAIDAGVRVPADWPDPLRAKDAARPDIGALAMNGEAWPIGVRGRLTANGERRLPEVIPRVEAWSFATSSRSQKPLADATKPSVIVQGYPAFDAPLIEFALRRRGVPVTTIERTWFDTNELGRYGLIAFDGSFTRAKIEPNKFSADDLVRLKNFLEAGGTLLLMRERSDLFATPDGQKFLTELVGGGAKEAKPQFKIKQLDHPWLHHLDQTAGRAWLNSPAVSPLRTSHGDNLIGTDAGTSMLYRLDVGQGQLIYFGWSVAAALPAGRQASALAQEAAFDEQMQILLRVTASVYPNPNGE